MRALERLSYRLRLDTPGAIAKLLLPSVFLVLAISGEIWLLDETWSRLRSGISSIWLAVALIVLPLIATAAYFRLPFSRARLRTHYVIKPVSSTNPSPKFDLSAITSILRRELAVWPTIGGRERAQSGPTSGSLTVSQVTIPLELLLQMLKQWVVGANEVIIETTLVQNEAGARLESWPKGYAPVLQPVIDGEPIETAVRKLALELIVVIDPDLGAAIKQGILDYDGALSILRNKAPSMVGDLSIAEMYMDVGQVDLIDRAIKHVDIAKDRYPLSKQDIFALNITKGEFQLKAGYYDDAEKLLKGLRPPRREWWKIWRKSKTTQERRRLKLLGDCNRNCEQIDAALSLYSKVEKLLLSEIKTIVRAPKPDFDDCLQRAVMGTYPALSPLLIELDELLESKAICEALRTADPTSEYLRWAQVVDARREIEDYAVSGRIALVAKEVGHVAMRNDNSEIAGSNFYNSTIWYENAISELKNQHLPLDIDLGARINLAWYEFGKWQCECALERLKGDFALSPEQTSCQQIFRDLQSRLSPEDAQSLSRHWGQARADGRRASPDNKAFWEAAVMGARVLLHSDPEEAKNVMSAIEQAISSVDLPVVPAEQSKRLRESAENAVGVKVSDKMLRLTAGLLNALLDVAEVDLARCDHRNEIDALTLKVLENFDGIAAHRLEEGFYGAACVHATFFWLINNSIEDNLSAARNYLQVAVANNQTFTGRARIDSDFFPIRGHDEFRDILGFPPAHIGDAVGSADFQSDVDSAESMSSSVH